MLAFSVIGSASCGIFMTVAAVSKTQFNATVALRAVFCNRSDPANRMERERLRKAVRKTESSAFYAGIRRRHIFWFAKNSVEACFGATSHRRSQSKTVQDFVFASKQTLDVFEFHASLQQAFFTAADVADAATPIVFGGFNNRLAEAIEWIESYKPEIPVRWPE